MEHRGACGCDPETGDGAGMLLQLPHKLFARDAEALKFSLPKKGEYAAGMMFLPQDAADRKQCIAIIEKTIEDEGQTVLGWREVPRDSSRIGYIARETEPVMMCTFTSKRIPVMPIGVRMPSWSLTLYSCGSTCKIC